MELDRLPDDLQPAEEDIQRMLLTSLELYCSTFAAIRATVSTVRGERNNIHDCMRTTAKTVFQTYIDTGNRFEIVIAERYFVRCKKLNVALETSNYPTQSVFNFEHQLRQGDLFEALAPVNLYVGYVPDPIDLRHSSLWVVRPGPGGWCYRLRPALTSTMPVHPVTDPNEKPAGTRVTPKRTTLRDAEGERK